MLPRRKISIHQEVTEVRTRKMDVSQVTWGDSSFILFTVLTKLWQILFFFSFFFGCATGHAGSFPTRNWTCAPAAEAQCLKHWTTRGVPVPLLSEKLFCVHFCDWSSHIAWSAKNAVILFWWLSAFYLTIFIPHSLWKHGHWGQRHVGLLIPELSWKYQWSVYLLAEEENHVSLLSLLAPRWKNKFCQLDKIPN